MPTLAARPYRRFLTSAFHKRFAHASALALLVCWDNAFWILHTGSYLWSWFPVGPAGLVALLLFGSSLAIFILEVATMNLGRRSGLSPFNTCRRYIFSISTAQTVLCYILSSWWFCEIYISSSPVKARLGWVNRGDMSTPDRLNERPIYLRSVHFLLALLQSANHLYNDFSTVHIPTLPQPSTLQPDQRTHHIDPITFQLQSAYVPMLQRCILTSFSVAILGPFIYTPFLRHRFWSLHLKMAKPIFSIPRSDARPSGYPPCTPALILRSFLSGFLLLLVWESSTFLFSALLAREPLKKGEPLSSGGKDPNGTLLSGLKARKDVVKTFAFWELVIIAQRLPERRKTIFAEIERTGGPCWSQMLDAALNIVHGINIRIKIEKASTVKPLPPNEQPPKKSPKIESLPRLTRQISNKPIVQSTPPPKTRAETLEHRVGQSVKWFGGSKEPWTPPVSKVKNYADRSGITKERANGLFEKMSIRLQAASSVFAWFFKTPLERRINAVILGSPYSNAALIVDAVESVTRMQVASLSEDDYGKVISGVPDTVRTLTKAVVAIETFVGANNQGGLSGIEEVEMVFDRLKAALSELLSGFQLYLTDVGLGIRELQEAKKASEKRPLIQKAEQQQDGSAKQSKLQGFTRLLQEEKSNDRDQKTRPKQNHAQGKGRVEQGRQERGSGRRIDKQIEAQDQPKRNAGWRFDKRGFEARPEMAMVR